MMMPVGGVFFSANNIIQEGYFLFLCNRSTANAKTSTRWGIAYTKCIFTDKTLPLHI